MIAISILLKATAILALTLLGVRLAGHSRASVRHVFLAAGFAALLLLPMASLVTPAVPIVVPAAVRQTIAPLDETSPNFDTAATRTSTIARTGSPAATRLELPSLTAFLIGGWVAGAVVFLFPVVVGLRQVRSIRRSALPWREARATVDALLAGANVRRPVDVLRHESLPGPMTCGVLRPAIVLPIDAPAWPAEDLRRAIIHELEHVRRADWLSQCIARVVAACYWFHPVVWVAWRQLALEAERACDDRVLAATSLTAGQDPSTAYADQLVDLAQRLSNGSNPPLLAMANRSDLATRVVAVLDRRQRRGRAGAACVATAVMATTVLATAVSSIEIVAAQQLPASSYVGTKPKYDAATIKPCEAEPNPTGARGTAGGTNATTSPGRFFVPCVTTEQLIYLAYASYGAPESDRLINDDFGTASNDKKIRGGPAWVHSLKEKYQIEATAVGATERTVLMGWMLQSLLEDRFKLKLHRETEEVPMQTLTIAKGGFRLKPMKEGDCEPYVPNAPMQPTGKAVCGALNMAGGDGRTRWTFGGFKISSLAGQLSRALGIHVIDKTGITDQFVFTFEFARDADTDGQAASVGTALEEQLGLKLTSTKAPRGFLVIDSIERPSTGGGRP
ncbi:MAG TPA: M56 family metallopeptidase [Vicinamibacterales bacterium]|nr:M56 family metallopeptidase [Vicinamibacterales bacterium]